MPLGLGLVAEATRHAGHEVEFLDLMFEAEPRIALRRSINMFQPEVIGISIRNIDDQNMENPRFLLEKVRPVIDECRANSSAPIVLGGAGYSIFPDETLAYLRADIGVCGDGETAFPALLARIQQGDNLSTVPGVHVQNQRISAGGTFSAELDMLPLPEENTWASADPRQVDIWVPIQSRRGCSNDCSYCSTSRIQGRAIRLRSPRLIVDHMERMTHAGFTKFYFVDNSFNIPEPHALELCRLITTFKLNVKWRCILYPQRVSAKLVQAMKEAGCVEVALGFESGCKRILREMNKHFVPEDVSRVAAMLGNHGIRRMGFLLLGGPGETHESVEESLAFADSLKLEGLKITVGIRIYPDTPLAKRALEDGVITSDQNLLFPCFYLARDIDPWIKEVINVKE